MDNDIKNNPDAFIDRIIATTTRDQATELYGDIWRDGHEAGWNNCLAEWERQDKTTAWKRDARTAELCWKAVKVCTGIIVALGLGSVYVELALKQHWPLPLP